MSAYIKLHERGIAFWWPKNRLPVIQPGEEGGSRLFGPGEDTPFNADETPEQVLDALMHATAYEDLRHLGEQ